MFENIFVTIILFQQISLVLCWPFCVFYGFQVDLEPFHAWSLGSKVVLIPGILLLIPDLLAFRSRALALISAPTYFVTTLKWRYLKEKLKASLYYPASVISALWMGGKDRWRGEGDKARGYSSPRGGEGGGAARSNPDRISDQKMSFSTAILEPSKIYSRIQTWHIDIDDIYMYQENWSETDENMCPNFYEQTFFFLNEKHENFCVTQLKMLHYY